MAEHVWLLTHRVPLMPRHLKWPKALRDCAQFCIGQFSSSTFLRIVQVLLPFIRSAGGKSPDVLMFATITFPFCLEFDNSFPYGLIVDCKVVTAATRKQ